MAQILLIFAKLETSELYIRCYQKMAEVIDVEEEQLIILAEVCR